MPLKPTNNYWKSPTMALSSNRDRFFLVGFILLFTPFFLLIFQPFGVNNYDPTHRIGLQLIVSATGFGVVNALTLAFFEFFIAPMCFPAPSRLLFVGRLALELILVATITFIFYNWLGNVHDWSWSSYWGFIRDVSLMSIIPITMLGLYFGYRNSYQAVQAYEVALTDSADDLIWLEPSHGSERLAVLPQHLLYLEAQDNYVAIFYLRDQRVLKLLMRTTLKRMEQQLQDHNIKRCHRSFLVNMDQINEVKVHQQQVRLRLHSSDVWLPVSKSYLSQLKDWSLFASNS
ncbi:MAG: LytTR family transcriptional regulator [Cyclobacteriaceae bacterium]|nr:LytTR family transcriptional regulator [Cyclobacteriaceae bacterium]